MINIEKLSNSAVLREIYNDYYSLNKTPNENLSSMWKEFYPQIHVSLDGEGNLVSFKGRGFSDIKYANPLSKILDSLCNASYFLRSPFKKELYSIICKIKPKLKKINSYITYNCFRQICSLILIKKHLNVDLNKRFDVVIIGDGHGVMAFLIKELFPNSRITLIDIGKVLLFQAVNLQLIFPECSHILIENGEIGVSEFDFLYVPSEKISKIKDIKYKLSINIASMQEMNYESVANYFKFLRHNSTPNNLFYCCNRLSKQLPGGEVLELLNYPWHKNDKHIIDEEPKFYRYIPIDKFPFMHYLDGRMQHRLTNLFIENKEDGINI